MKYARYAFLLIPFALLACGDSTSGGDSRGDLQYERHSKPSSFVKGECYVYATDSRVTFDAQMTLGKSSPAVFHSEVEIAGNSVKLKDELTTTSALFAELVENQCETIKPTYDDIGGTVSCTATEVKGSGTMKDVAPEKIAGMRSVMISHLSATCDDFIDRMDDEELTVDGFSEQGEKAQSCKVNLEGNVMSMDVVYADRSASYKTTWMDDGFTLNEETYVGVSADTLALICSSYKVEEGLVDVVCDGSTITYKGVPEDFDMADMRTYLENVLCPAFLNGTETLEDLWFGE